MQRQSVISQLVIAETKKAGRAAEQQSSRDLNYVPLRITKYVTVDPRTPLPPAEHAARVCILFVYSVPGIYYARYNFLLRSIKYVPGNTRHNTPARTQTVQRTKAAVTDEEEGKIQINRKIDL